MPRSARTPGRPDPRLRRRADPLLGQIVRFRSPDAAPAAESSAAPALVESASGDVPLDEGQLLIRDERGVRLARETEVTD